MLHSLSDSNFGGFKGVGASGGIGMWVFAKAPARYDAGPNDAAQNLFRNRGKTSFVREVIQNSLDAQDEGATSPVHVSISLDGIRPNGGHGMLELAPHLESCMDNHKEGSEDHERYESMVREIEEEDSRVILGIHDYNTTGAEKSGEGIQNPWGALVYGSGRSSKPSSTSGGSFGHGANAVLVQSKISTVYYYTRFGEDEGKELFTGKCVFETHGNPQAAGAGHGAGGDETVMEVGYFLEDGRGSEFQGGEIPEWCLEARDEAAPEDLKGQKTLGTSVFVACPDYGDDDLALMVCIAIANFACSILSGKLTVSIGSVRLDSKTLKGLYAKYEGEMKKLDEESLIDGDEKAHLQDSWKIASAVLGPSSSETLEVDGYGEVKCYVLEDQDGICKVGVARDAGMLVSYSDKGLNRRGGRRPYNAFAHVIGSEGSKFLRSLENPEHNSFSVNNLKIKGDKREASKRLKKLRDAVNEHIESIVGSSARQSQVIRIMSEILGIKESGRSISRSVIGKIHEIDAERTEREILTRGIDIKKPEKSIFQQSKGKRQHALTNIRTVNEGGGAAVYFDCEASGDARVSIYGSGDSSGKRLIWEGEVVVTSEARNKIELDSLAGDCIISGDAVPVEDLREDGR